MSERQPVPQGPPEGLPEVFLPHVRCHNCKWGRHENCEQLRYVLFGVMNQPCDCDCVKVREQELGEAR